MTVSVLCWNSFLLCMCVCCRFLICGYHKGYRKMIHQFSSVTQLCSTLWDPMDCSMPGFPVHHQLPEPAQTHVHRVGDTIQPSNHLIRCRPLLLLPSIFSSIRVFSSELVLRIRWPKCWNLSFSISLSNEYSALIAFRMDWLALLAVQGNLKSLLQQPQFKSINSSIAQLSLYSNSHIHIRLLEKPQLWLDGPLLAKQCLCFLICCLSWS